MYQNFRFFHLLKIPAGSRGDLNRRCLAHQVLFPGSSSTRVKPARRAAPRRRISRVSGASVGVRDARYFKFHPGYRAHSPRPILLPFLSPFSVSVHHGFPSALLRNVSPTTSCCHLIPEVDESAGLLHGFLTLPRFLFRENDRRTAIHRVCVRCY